MPVQSFYGGGARNVGTPIAGEFLHRYFSTIKGMNDADRASSGAETASDLAELEAEARTRMGQLASTLAEVRNGDTRSYNDLRKAYLQAVSAEEQTAVRANTDIAIKRMDVYLGAWEGAVRDDKQLSAEITVSDEAAEMLRNVGRNSFEDPDTSAENFESLAQKENAGAVGTPKRDHMAGRWIASTQRNKGSEYAEQTWRSMGYEQDPRIEFVERHAPTTREAADDAVDAWVRKTGGGGRGTGGARSGLTDMGISPEELEADGVSTRTSTRTPTGGAGAGAPVSVGVAARGLSSAALQAMAGEQDPYKALQAAIEAQADYADDLARRREAASKGSGLYPRGNEYTVSPNRISLGPVSRTDHPSAPSPTAPVKMSGTVTGEREPDVRGGTTSFEDRTDPRDEWKWRNPAPAPRLEPQSVKGTRFDPGSTQFIHDAIGAGTSEADEFDAFKIDADADEFDAFKETK